MREVHITVEAPRGVKVLFDVKQPQATQGISIARRQKDGCPYHWKDSINYQRWHYLRKRLMRPPTQEEMENHARKPKEKQQAPEEQKQPEKTVDEERAYALHLAMKDRAWEEYNREHDCDPRCHSCKGELIGPGVSEYQPSKKGEGRWYHENGKCKPAK